MTTLAQQLLYLLVQKEAEQGRAEDIYGNPKHPYTRALLAAAPVLETASAKKTPRKLLRGDIPDPAHPPMGCVFHPRCPLAEQACVQSIPQLRRVSGEQYAACHFVAAGSH